jgi:DNA-binding transcriptional regulator YbjK
MAKVEKKAKPRERSIADETAVDIFAEAVVDGKTQAEAYRLSHPNCKASHNTARVKGYEYAQRPVVRERIEELRRELHERHAGFRDKLIEMLTEEISTCYADNHTLSPVIKQVEVVTRVLGMDKQVIDLKADVRAVDDSTAADKLNFLAQQAGGKR